VEGTGEPRAGERVAREERGGDVEAMGTEDMSGVERAGIEVCVGVPFLP